ncbi:hypothetical protein CYMTET_55912, partial [Cymbomonas tetramitiformis]
VSDAAQRLAFLALSEPTRRPGSINDSEWATRATRRAKYSNQRTYTLRVYDAVGPETVSILQLLQIFARFNGRTLRPVHIDYRNYERVLNVASLGNLNRQFVSILRSEQDSGVQPILGKSVGFEKLLGEDATLTTLQDALFSPDSVQARRRSFPIRTTLRGRDADA